MHRKLVSLALVLFNLSCTEIAIVDQDMNPEILFGGESAGAGVLIGGDSAGESAGFLAGDTTDTGYSAQDQFVDDSLLQAGELAGDQAGEMSNTQDQCGDQVCDPNAICVSGSEGPRCQCQSRYEGDGISCSPRPCPMYASGAPNCNCDDGYEGDLNFDLSTETWVGSCRLVNPCELITIQGQSFIDTTDPMIGDTIHEECTAEGSTIERYRFSMEEGEVYSYYSSNGERACDESPNMAVQQDQVDSWAYSGGVLTDEGLFHVRDLSYGIGDCTYHVLGVRNGLALEIVYLAPIGRSCNIGEIRPISCGQGACRADGVMRCENGEWLEDCTPEPGSIDADLCDGIDSDCDGLNDEDFMAEVTTCGLGICVSSGISSCESGIETDSCQPEPSSDVDDSCDGIDQDCDGSSDEQFQTRMISCGVGACSADGIVQCREGTEHTQCTPEAPIGNDADCNNIDEDCDGFTDEDFVGQAVSCGVGACFFEGFTRCIDGVAEDTCTPLDPAENDTSCDGIDDDCDGRVDEDYEPQITTCGLGVCLNSAVTACVNGEELDSCQAGSPIGEDLECDNVDSDCDGRLDEAFVSQAIPCSGSGVYECTVTAPLLCLNGQTNFDCDGALSAITDSSCDGLDDDCDGRLDENYVSIEVSCGLGECADTSMSRCVDGEVTDRCVPLSPTGDDSDCNGRDDDCDGSSDESFVESTITCGQGVCTSQGTARCLSGQYLTDCEPGSPVNLDESVCNNLDDDCDGRIDETYTSTRNYCGFGVCASVGSSSCTAGVESLNCEPLLPTGDDADCDGLDQDCDDQADEDYTPQLDQCGTGVCFNTATSSCLDGAVQNNCEPLPQQGDDSRCDGIDQDCDGRVDEAYLPVPTTCTFGSVCIQEGLTACVNGQVQDVCDPPLFFTGSDNDCNTEDNDCDGSFDEGYIGSSYNCGSGVCRASGFRSCIDGEEGEGDCSPNQHLASSDANCNGVDDDCDGRTDEHYINSTVTCGRGVCRRSGTLSCSAGSVLNSCIPGSATGPDNTFNNLDDDCDGRTDESACTFVSNNDLCNGNDDDCDGRVDEDFSNFSDTCGSGVCASIGTVTCNNGNEVSSCTPLNNNASPDNNCDGQDNDCDGSVDEAFVGGLSTCGVGACYREGTFVCVNGSTSSTCVAGTPGPEIANNGIDEDCNGSDYTGPVAPSGLTITSTHRIVQEGSSFKAVWDGTSTPEANAAQALLRYLTGRSSVTECESYPNCDHVSYPFQGLGFDIWNAQSPYPFVASVSANRAESVAFYHQDYYQTYVVVLNANLSNSNITGSFIYSLY